MPLAGTASNNTANLPAGLGIVADEVSQELVDGGWTDGRNVRFSDGYAAKTDGYRAILTTPVAAAYHVASYPVGTARNWIHATLTGTYADDGTTQSDITGTALTGATTDRFTSCVLAGVYYQTNGKDEPYAWGGTGTMVTLTGWDSTWRCKALRSFGSYLVALNITKGSSSYPSMVKWSHPALPGSQPSTWDETDATKDAGEVDLAGTPDVCVDCLQLGEDLIVYKERSAYRMQFIGGNDIFRFARIPGDYGCLAPNCAVNFPGGHVVLTAGPDLVVHAGNEPRSVLAGRMRKWLFDRINSDHWAQSFVVANHARSEVWVCFPSTASTGPCDTALVWNYEQNTFGTVDLPNVTAGAFGPFETSVTDTWDASTDTWDTADYSWNQSDISLAGRRVVLASTAPGLYLVDKGDTADGTAITASLERTGMAFGDPEYVKLLRGITPRVDAPTGTVLSIQAGAANDVEEAPVWGSAVTYTVGQTRKADLFACGRFLSVRISSAGFGAWRIKSAGFDVVRQGLY